MNALNNIPNQQTSGGHDWNQRTNWQSLQNLGVPPEKLIRGGVKEYLKAKLREAKTEAHEIETKYNVKTSEELEEKIRKGAVEEHPAWEALIQYENILKRTQKIQKEVDSIPS